MKYNYNQICTQDSEVNVGETYQYKESSFVANVKVLEDNSNKEWVSFKLEITNGPDKGQVFTMDFIRLLDGKPYAYSGMARLYDYGTYYTGQEPLKPVQTENKKYFEVAGRKVGVKKLKQSEKPFCRTPTFEEYKNPSTDDLLSLPNNYNIEGVAFNNVVEGQAFQVARTKRNGIEAEGWFHTSIIKDIMVREDKKSAIFTTMNSIYSIEILD